MERWIKLNNKWIHVVFTKNESYIDGTKVEDNINSHQNSE
jgi:hypothetical protein